MRKGYPEDGRKELRGLPDIPTTLNCLQDGRKGLR